MMKVKDIGPLQGAVLVFGGPCSNLEATRAIRAEARRLEIPPQRVICTGDVVAYCAYPRETVELIRCWGIQMVQGNCEESLATDSVDCKCGFADDSPCSLLSLGWYPYARASITELQRRWMGQLPGALTFSLNGVRCRVVHGSPERINEFVFASDPLSNKRRQLDLSGTDVVIGGHCGLPFGQATGSGYWLNAGVIGMPANDGTKDGWYMLLTPEHEGVLTSWHRLRYDARSSRRAMLEAGLGASYADALVTGIWPSDDILPEQERISRGQPLSLSPLYLTSAG